MILQPSIALPQPWLPETVTSSATILGIPTGRNLLLTDVWKPTLDKLLLVSQCLNSIHTSLSQHIRLLNTYWVPITSYISRFVYLSKGTGTTIAKYLRIALGPHNAVPSSLLFSTSPPFNLPIPLRHPVLAAIASLASLDPSLFPSTTPKSPTSTCFGRAIALSDVASCFPLFHSPADVLLSSHPQELIGPHVSKWYYSLLTSKLPGPSLLGKGFESQDLPLVLLNLDFNPPPSLKTTFLRFITHSWHFHAHPSTCPFCATDLISYLHLHLCPVINAIYDSPPFLPPQLALHSCPPLNDRNICLIFSPANHQVALYIMALLHAVRLTLLSSPFSSTMVAKKSLLSRFKSLLAETKFPPPPIPIPTVIPSHSNLPVFPIGIPALFLT